MTLSETWTDPLCASEAPPAGGDRSRFCFLDYRSLVGADRAKSVVDDNDKFDRHVLASILDVAEMDGVAGAEASGLSDAELNALIDGWFPEARYIVAVWGPSALKPEDEEVTMVRDLLLANRSSQGDVGRWLAAMIARRSMEPNHLWEDLGLRERSELTRLLTRHFAPLANRNTKNMRWKRFFYRMLCEDDGFVMCTTPVCTQCRDFDLCFGDESGESRMADRRREVALREAEQRSFESAPSRSSDR